MRVLLDEQLNRRHCLDFSSWIQATTVEGQGWKGTKNGTLLHLAAQEFDAFITMDRGIEYQQRWREYNLILIIVLAKTNRYTDVKPLIPLVEQALSTARPGQFIHISGATM
jgi:hypothetical protein